MSPKEVSMNAQRVLGGILATACLMGAPAAIAADDTVAKQYGTLCASCHGADGKGNAVMAPAFQVEASDLDLTDEKTLGKDDAELAKVTANGEGKMPAYSANLKAEEIAALVAYIRSLAP